MSQILDINPGDRIIVDGIAISFEEIVGLVKERKARFGARLYRRQSSPAVKLNRKIALCAYAVRTGRWTSGATVLDAVERLTATLKEVIANRVVLSDKAMAALNKIPSNKISPALYDAAAEAIRITTLSQGKTT